MALVYNPTNRAEDIQSRWQFDQYILSRLNPTQPPAPPPYAPPQCIASPHPETQNTCPTSATSNSDPALHSRYRPFGPRSRGSKRHERPNPSPTVPALVDLRLRLSSSIHAQPFSTLEQFHFRGPEVPSITQAVMQLEEHTCDSQEVQYSPPSYSASRSSHSPHPQTQAPIHSFLAETLAEASTSSLMASAARRSQQSRSSSLSLIDNSRVMHSTPCTEPFRPSAQSGQIPIEADARARLALHSRSSAMTLPPPTDSNNPWRDTSDEIDITSDIAEILAGLGSNEEATTKSTSTRHHPPRVLAPPCSICLDIPDQFPGILPTLRCTHASSTCASCLERHISHAVQSQGSTILTCPDPECRQVMEYEDVIRGAGRDMACLDRYETLLLRRTLENDPNYVWCKNPACGWGQIHEGGADTPIVTCQACNARSCFTHDMPWHSGLTCKQYTVASLKADEASQAYIDKHAKICPNPSCGRWIEKAEGCDHMTCRRPAGCGHEFCWVCLADYDSIRKEGNHRHKTSCIHYVSSMISDPFRTHNRPQTFLGLETVPEEPFTRPVTVRFRPVVELQPRLNPFTSILPAFLQRYYSPRSRRLNNRARA